MKQNFISQQIVSSFSDLEKQAAYQVFCGAIRADGKVTEQELALLTEIRQQLLIYDSDVIASRKLSEEDITRVLKNLPDFKKLYIIKFIAMLCLSDNEVHPFEAGFVNYIAEKIGAPIEQFNSI